MQAAAGKRDSFRPTRGGTGCWLVGLVLFAAFLGPAGGASAQNLFDDLDLDTVVSLEAAAAEVEKRYERLNAANDWWAAELAVGRIQRRLDALEANGEPTLFDDEYEEWRRLKDDLADAKVRLAGVARRGRAAGAKPPKDGRWPPHMETYRQKLFEAGQKMRHALDQQLASAERQLNACRLEQAGHDLQTPGRVVARFGGDMFQDSARWFQRLSERHRRLTDAMNSARRLHTSAKAAARTAVGTARAGDLIGAQALYRKAKADWEKARQALAGSGCDKELFTIDTALRKVDAALAEIDKRLGSGIIPPVPPGGCRQVCEPEQRCEVREVCEWKVESLDGRIGQCTGGNWNPDNCEERYDCDKTEKVCETVENCRTVCD
jgi:hypothetical protein